MTTNISTNRVNKVLLEEAADWAMTLHYESPTPTDYEEFERWKHQSPAHEMAWRQVQSVFHTFEQVPSELSKTAFKKLDGRYDRRQAIKLLTTLAVTLPLGWYVGRQLPWQHWTADVATLRGELKTLTLTDGSLIVLNSASAVNVQYDQQERRVRLIAGEVLITTHSDPVPQTRPFLVSTPVGVVRALGTRFSVRQLSPDRYHVSVFESAVEIRTQTGALKTLNAGEQADFSAGSIKPSVPVGQHATLWEKGMLLAKDWTLAEVITELGRYRHGVLRCEPAVASLKVSGALSLIDTDASLAVLEKSLPIRIRRVMNYWITIAAEA